MSARPTPVRTVLAGILSTFQSPASGITTQGQGSVTFEQGLTDEDIENLIRGSGKMPLFLVRCEGFDPAVEHNVGEIHWSMKIGCYYFQRSAQQQKAEADAWDVMLRAAQVVGEELAKPGGSSGNYNLFGIASGRNRITDINPAGGIRVVPLRGPDGAFLGVLMGSYEFTLEYRMNIRGDTD